MFVPFNELPDSCRIWIYQSNHPFKEEDLPELNKKLQQFIHEWTVHGANLSASYEIKYNRFVIIGVDEDYAATSGCSVDASVHFIQKLEQEYNVDLLDKMNVIFKQGEFLTYKDLKDFKTMVKNRSVSPKTIVFNNLVNTKGEYKDYWEVPLEESWHKRFL